MKTFALFVVAIVCLVFINNVFAGSIKLEKSWVQNDYAYAIVYYENDTDVTYKKAVRIRCVVVDSKGVTVGVNTRSFFAHEYGPIQPGFKGRLKVPVQLNGASAKSISCKCIEW